MPPSPLLPLASLSTEFAQKLAQTTGAQDAYQRIQPLDRDGSCQIKLLGWMLIHAPSPEGRTYLVQSIARCEDDGKIFELGDFHLNHFINYFKSKRRDKSRTPSTHPSRPSVETLRQAISDSLAPTPTSHTEAKAYALIRDRYRCMLTGDVDFVSHLNIPHLQEEVDENGLILSRAQCAHILPSYVNKGIQGDSAKRGFASNVWSIAQLYGGIPPAECSGSEMHNLRNIMTLNVIAHDLFDNLLIWLEPVEGTENQYVIGRARPGVAPSLPGVVTFTSAFPGQLPLPDRRYLAFHAACAKVVLMSGAAEHINKILDDLERTQVLSEDGASAELLDSLLAGILVCY